ncbi:MAG: Mut7-C ubiquitin/RNAse domain-containing protein [Anaerolineales bacterium]|nr:Mut7-C ubiquitin/RNAse domain-containing protein [Anaerolineales bacterium]MDW8226995.1 Mut7-C RNAse domain-containing protein [Anaerolineales bacterium]
MNTARFVFFGTLNDLLERALRGKEIVLTFAEHQTVKHLIESLGVPHVEVGEVTANGQMVGWEYRPRNGDRIEVRPAFGWEGEPRFVLDNHLGRLAAYLRMLGFDTLYKNNYCDEELAALLTKDSRILLTRDRRLLMRKVVRYGYCLRSLEPQEQLQEVIRRFDLLRQARPFHRCLRCNHPLERVEKGAILDRLEPKTKLYYEEFARCPACDQIYWQGSHFERMQGMLAGLKTSADKADFYQTHRN